MPAFLATWFASNIFKLVVVILALIGIVAGPTAVIQTVRIDGLDLAGWYVVKGYRPLYLQDESDLKQSRANEGTLKTGLDACNGSVAKLKQEGDARVAAAQAKVDKAQAGLDAADAAIARMRKIASSKEVCSVADQILRAGFQ